MTVSKLVEFSSLRRLKLHMADHIDIHRTAPEILLHLAYPETLEELVLSSFLYPFLLPLSRFLNGELICMEIHLETTTCDGWSVLFMPFHAGLVMIKDSCSYAQSHNESKKKSKHWRYTDELQPRNHLCRKLWEDPVTWLLQSKVCSYALCTLHMSVSRPFMLHDNPLMQYVKLSKLIIEDNCQL